MTIARSVLLAVVALGLLAAPHTAESQPAGKVAGVTFLSSDLAAKRLQFLKEVAPAISRIGILWNPDHIDPEYRETQLAARQLGLHLHSLEARAPADFEGALAAAAVARVEAI